MDLKVFIASHRDYAFPKDEAYQPIHVGRATSGVQLPFLGDDTGDNISCLNRSYCELTGLYWAWRNTRHDIYGLVHYRRYFRGAGNRPATGAEMHAMLAGADVVVPNRRNYVIQTVKKQYANSHHASDLEIVRQVLLDRAPSTVAGYDDLMRSRSLSLYSMFLMRRQLLDEYCGWLFEILEAVHKEIPIEVYGPQQQRVIGYLGERLMNVWLNSQPKLRVSRQKVYEPERTPYVVAGVQMVGRMAGVGRAN
ncbi:DUF4422 domain-containing protein [Nocardioides pantholopis]|uniref:DUF4422 domain-containing protein n=1 Tax=Nocardioides pantholopis TaxID=2483798 RepID=UPI0013E2E1C8|nr:DUF4422 domain-containing protein [Nocardioides pantholopis]